MLAFKECRNTFEYAGMNAFENFFLHLLSLLMLRSCPLKNVEILNLLGYLTHDDNTFYRNFYQDFKNEASFTTSEALLSKNLYYDITRGTVFYTKFNS